MTLASTLVPKRTTAVAWQTIDSELVLLRIDADELMGVNEVGARIWELADGTRSIEEIARDLAATFDVPEPTAFDDASRFLEDLVKLDAIELLSGVRP